VPLGHDARKIGVAAGPAIVPAGVRTASPTTQAAAAVIAARTGDNRRRASARGPSTASGLSLTFGGPALDVRWAIEHVVVTGTTPGNPQVTVWANDPFGPAGAVMLSTLPVQLDLTLIGFFGDRDYPKDLIVMGGEILVIRFDNCTLGQNQFATVQYREI
jgi:hypothetical protein